MSDDPPVETQPTLDLQSVVQRRLRDLCRLRDEAQIKAGDTLLIAFSGGPDSTALLSASLDLAPSLGIRLRAAHYDHRLDPGSANRAHRARALSHALGIPCLVGTRRPRQQAEPGESPEATARRLRYRFLERARCRLGARYVLTAHHLDDQAETLLLRILFGTGIEGLSGIQPRRERVLRPLLEVPQQQLRSYLAQRELEAIEDPTNRLVSVPRNRLRLETLPHLSSELPDLSARLAALAGQAQRARPKLEALLAKALAPRAAFRGIAIPRRRLERLILEQHSPELLAAALALLHRRAGAPHPARSSARRELARQLARDGLIGCDCGAGWRWEQRGKLVVLGRDSPQLAAFTYTLRIPGELTIPELGLILRVRRLTDASGEPPSLESRLGDGSGSRPRLGLGAPSLDLGAPRYGTARLSSGLCPGDSITVRNRRPGDRLQPAGSSTEKRLKEVLIERRVPRAQRDEIPLVCVGRNIAWAVGVTLDERFVHPGPGPTWLVEAEPVEAEPAETIE